MVRISKEHIYGDLIFSKAVGLLAPVVTSTHFWKRSSKDVLQEPCYKPWYSMASQLLCWGSSGDTYLRLILTEIEGLFSCWKLNLISDILKGLACLHTPATLLVLNAHLLSLHPDGALGPESAFINHWRRSSKDDPHKGAFRYNLFYYAVFLAMQ